MELIKYLLKTIENKSDKVTLKSCNSLEEIYEKFKKSGFKGTYCDFEKEYTKIFLNLIEKVSEEELKTVSGGIINKAFSKTLATTLTALSVSGAVLPSVGATNYPFTNEDTTQNKVLKFIKENPKKSIGALISGLSIVGIGIGVGTGLLYYNKNKQVKNLDELIIQIKSILLIKNKHEGVEKDIIILLKNYFLNKCNNKEYSDLEEIRKEINTIDKVVYDLNKKEYDHDLKDYFIRCISRIFHDAIEVAKYKGSNDNEKLELFTKFCKYVEEKINEKRYKDTIIDEDNFLQLIRNRKIKSSFPKNVIHKINALNEDDEDSEAIPLINLFIEEKDKNVISADFFDNNGISVYGINENGEKISSTPKTKKNLRIYTNRVGEAYLIPNDQEKNFKLEFDSNIWNEVKLSQDNITCYANKTKNLIIVCSSTGLVIDDELCPQVITEKGYKEFLKIDDYLKKNTNDTCILYDLTHRQQF